MPSSRHCSASRFYTVCRCRCCMRQLTDCPFPVCLPRAGSRLPACSCRLYDQVWQRTVRCGRSRPLTSSRSQAGRGSQGPECGPRNCDPRRYRLPKPSRLILTTSYSCLALLRTAPLCVFSSWVGLAPAVGQERRLTLSGRACQSSCYQTASYLHWDRYLRSPAALAWLPTFYWIKSTATLCWLLIFNLIIPNWYK